MHVRMYGCVVFHAGKQMFTSASRLVALWEEKKTALSWNRTHVPWLKLPVLRPLGYGCPANYRPSLAPLYMSHTAAYVAIVIAQAFPHQCSSNALEYCSCFWKEKRQNFPGIEPTSLGSSCQCLDHWAMNAQPTTGPLFFLYICTSYY